jgi:hypothetical protein
MQLFQTPFDAKTVKPNEAFEPLPAGWYNAKINTSEAKPTKDNESGYLLFELEILDGEYKGRKIFDRLNLWNKSVQASEIAQRQLSAYCHATGVFILQDSVQLHGIPLKIKLNQRPAENGYEASNEVKAVKHIQDTTPTAAAPSFAAPAASPFGVNPSLPAQPAPAVPQQVAATGGFPPPAAAPAFGPPATAPQQTPWAPPSAPAAAPQAGPVPPWRK